MCVCECIYVAARGDERAISDLIAPISCRARAFDAIFLLTDSPLMAFYERPGRVFVFARMYR